MDKQTQQAPTDERVQLTADAARELAQAALRGIGYDAAQSVAMADHMLDAALCGYEYSGLPKILNVAEYRGKHPPTGPMRLCHETPLSSRFDGGMNNGMWTMHEASRLAITKAQAYGMALVGVNRTWMSGRGAYYVEMLARAGLIGIHTVASRPQVAPPGAAKAAIGTNPISFGFPKEGDPLVIDMGTSTLMFTDLALRARRGELLPEGLAIDAQGHPTRDPVAASAGAALSFGGYKGFALALANLAMGILAGSGDDPEHAGYLIIAVKPDLMLPLDDYRRTLAENIERIKATPRQGGVDEIRIPSEHSFRARERNLKQGITIDRRIRDALVEFAGG